MHVKCVNVNALHPLAKNSIQFVVRANAYTLNANDWLLARPLSYRKLKRK